MFDIQEREEQDFNRMGPAEEMRWQHAQGMRCSFDCAACDPAEQEIDPDWADTPVDVAAFALIAEPNLTDPWF